MMILDSTKRLISRAKVSSVSSVSSLSSVLALMLAEGYKVEERGEKETAGMDVRVCVCEEERRGVRVSQRESEGRWGITAAKIVDTVHFSTQGNGFPSCSHSRINERGSRQLCVFCASVFAYV